METLQLDPNQLNPEQERLPQQLLEKCAALSVRPNAIKDLVDSMGGWSYKNLSRHMGKPTICKGKKKGADQLQRHCFRYSDSTIPLLSKSKISSL